MEENIDYHKEEIERKMNRTALVLGGHGFIGHHLARRLKNEGYWVRTVDIKHYEYGDYDFCDEYVIGDLRKKSVVESVVRLNKQRQYSYLPLPFEEIVEFDEIYCLACLMGGAGFIFTKQNDAEIMSDSALININIVKVLGELQFKGKVYQKLQQQCVGRWLR